MTETRVKILCSPQANIGEFHVELDIAPTTEEEAGIIRFLPHTKQVWREGEEPRPVIGFHFSLIGLSSDRAMELIEEHSRLIAGEDGEVIIYEPTAEYPTWLG